MPDNDVAQGAAQDAPDGAVEFSLMDMVPQVIKDTEVSLIRTFDAYARQFDNVIRLTLGEPDFNTPQAIKDAAVESLKANHTHYPPTAGTPEYREAVAGFLKRRRGLDYTPDQIIATVGASEGIRATMSALVSPGDVVIIPTPAFSFYGTIAEQIGARPVYIDTSYSDFRLQPKYLDRTLSALEDINTLLVLNYPNNPTGVSLTRAEVKALADVAAEHKVGILSDEPYALITYDEPATSIAEFLPDRTVLVDSCSKSLAMTGWRLGYVAGPQDIINQIVKVHQHLVATAPRTAMDAATVGYNECDKDIDQMVKEYKKRRNTLYYGLQSLDFECVKPEGAFYIYARIPDKFESTMDFAKQMVAKAGVAAVPGEAFARNSRHVRFSYAASEESLREALHRISAWKAKEGF